MSVGNDEPIAAHLWGLPSLALVAALAAPFVLIAWSIIRTFDATPARKALHALAFLVIMFGVGTLVGSVLDPWVFPPPVIHRSP